MAKRQVTHIQGQRGESFLQLVRGVPQDKVLCVTIDVHKAYHRIMIVNGYYEIVERAFSIDILRDGLKQLCQLIDQAVTRTGARVLFIGMEPTGHYHENLARHLRQRYPHVRLVNSYAVKENRNQRMLRAEKDDDKDLCSIAELVLRNECFPYQPLTGDYLHLQNWSALPRARRVSSHRPSAGSGTPWQRSACWRSARTLAAWRTCRLRRW